MSILHCDRCGALFETDERFMTANVHVITNDDRETLHQVLLCHSCIRDVEDSLTLETTIFEHT
ncbi:MULTISPECIES: hypothetical protein [Haloferax]|uniref:Uncharacterized protein n=2 Tax=Haloferax TaxID=2251 RepID=A0A6G1Z0G5_9EURY|nr:MULTISPECIES: hypothetical protein [Haloferax]KAB1187238.1 hypothetical protein Hfx1149_04025 [Haloferax sp. CBA1149]MRW79881.1 hypothetical protein [Haloferax marinisediminis]